jgi:signal transduction histidine kinase
MHKHKKFRDFKIQTKQIVGFGIILLIFASVNIYSIIAMKDLRTELEIASSNSLPRAFSISDINNASANLRIAQLQLIFEEDKKEENIHTEKISELIDDINENKDEYEALIETSKKSDLYSIEEEELYHEFDSLWDEYLTYSLNCVLLIREGKTNEAIEVLNGDAKIIYDAYSTILRKMLSLYGAYLIDSANRATETFTKARDFTLTLIIITIIISIFMAIVIVRLITVPLGRMEQAAIAVGEGDLWVNVKYHSKDELGMLAQTFNNMIVSLREANEKMEEKSEKLHMQWEVLRETNDERKEKSELLEQQRKETEQKNKDLESTLSKLKEAQNQLVQSEKMASVGQLTAGIAHEINNPINFVSSNVAPLKRDVADILSILEQYENVAKTKTNGFEKIEALKKELDFDFLIDEINNLLKGIEEGARRTTDIVRGLRNFSRLDEDEQKLADIRLGIESTLLVLKNELKNKVEVVTHFANIPQILCYPGKLNQVFLNIIQNATQAIETTGKIEISTSMDEDWVYISIKDNGKGMSAEVAQRVFDPFFTTKDVGKGTGLGLSVSFGIIQEHNGDITIQSEPGKGAEFLIKIPNKN